MNTRRKFLLQGSMATTALLVAKPFDTFAKITSPVTGLTSNSNSLLFVHTGAASVSHTAEHLAALKNNYANVMLLHAGTVVPKQLQQLKYDACIENTVNTISSNAYKIVYKGDFKTGVMSIDTAVANPVDEVNNLAAYLKKEKNCDIVICISHLGYRNETGIDDIQLAAASQHIDVIIGAHAENFSSLPAIALNKNNGEVIIDHASANTANTTAQVGKIAISFDNKGQKNNIAF